MPKKYCYALFLQLLLSDVTQLLELLQDVFMHWMCTFMISDVERMTQSSPKQ